MRTTTRPAAAVLLTTLVAMALAACTGGATATQSPTLAATPVPASVPPTPDPCSKENLTTTTAGKLTVGADNPAYPPYFDPAPADPAWELGNPNNGKGFESAVAFAVADVLGFAKEDVTWIPVPFDNAIAPGNKEFDIYLTQVSYSADRAQAVDLSDGYFDQSQTVIALASNPIAKVTTVAELKAFKLGAPAGTTSYDYIVDTIQPTADASAYNSLSDAIAGLNAKQIDGVVVDLPTAFYATAAQMEKGKIVGTLPNVGEVDHFSIVLDKGSPLTECVNQALAQLSTDGTLLAITDEWITGQGAPELN
jgi:polar amino acid transport system substrate-binding protein